MRSAALETATVSMPSSRQARMMRTAISPRLAIRSRAKGGAVVAMGGAVVSLRKDAARSASAGGGSERDVAMLLSVICVPLCLQHLEGPDDPGPRLRRPDDVVNVAASGGGVRGGGTRLRRPRTHARRR